VFNKGSSADSSSSGSLPATFLWKLSAEHFGGRRAPKDLTLPRTWLTSLVLAPTSASRERTSAR
jgi:hypothetical protein